MRKTGIFFVLAFSISWLIWLPLYGHIFGIDIEPIPYNHALGGFGPMLAAIITTIIYQKEKLAGLLKSMLRAGSITMLLVAILAPFVIALLSIVTNGIVTGRFENVSTLLRSDEFPDWSFIQFVMYNLIFFGFGEETGWRGFALPEFQKKLKPLAASVLLTVFWAAWHWPLFFYRPGYVSMGFAGIVGWIFSLLTGSVLLTWLYNNSRQSVLICAIFHATIDIAFTANYTDKDISNYLGFFITFWGIRTAYHLYHKQKTTVSALQ